MRASTAAAGSSSIGVASAETMGRLTHFVMRGLDPRNNPKRRPDDVWTPLRVGPPDEPAGDDAPP